MKLHANDLGTCGVSQAFYAGAVPGWQRDFSRAAYDGNKEQCPETHPKGVGQLHIPQQQQRFFQLQEENGNSDL